MIHEDIESLDQSYEGKDLKEGISKKPWTKDEDEQLKKLVHVNGTGSWTIVSELLTERTGKQCRERWFNHLNPAINKSEWTPEEDNVLISMQKVFGNQWSKVISFIKILFQF